MDPSMPVFDAQSVRTCAVHATNRFLMQQMRSWSMETGCQNATDLSIHPPTEEMARWRLELMVDRRLWTASWSTDADLKAVSRLTIVAPTITYAKDSALVLLAAAALTSQRVVQMLYRPFREIYEASPQGVLRIARILEIDKEADEKELHTWD